jgi:hypothetical protein
MRRFPRGKYADRRDGRATADSLKRALAGLAGSLMLAVLAGQLPVASQPTSGRRSKRRVVKPRRAREHGLVRRLNVDESWAWWCRRSRWGEQIKGRRAWERYRHLEGLRDDLVHVKDRGVDPECAMRTRLRSAAARRVRQLGA